MSVAEAFTPAPPVVAAPVDAGADGGATSIYITKAGVGQVLPPSIDDAERDRLVKLAEDLHGTEAWKTAEEENGSPASGTHAQFVVDPALDADSSRVTRLVLANCDAFDQFPPAPFTLLFPLLRNESRAKFLASQMRMRPLRQSRLGFGLLAKNLPAELTRGWIEPARTNAGVRRDAVRLLKNIRPQELLDVSTRLRDVKIPVTVKMRKGWDDIVPGEPRKTIPYTLTKAAIEPRPSTRATGLRSPAASRILSRCRSAEGFSSAAAATSTAATVTVVVRALDTDELLDDNSSILWQEAAPAASGAAASISAASSAVGFMRASGLTCES